MNVKAVIHEEEAGGYGAEVPAPAGRATRLGAMEERLADPREAIEGFRSVEVEAPPPDGRALERSS